MKKIITTVLLLTLFVSVLFASNVLYNSESNQYQTFLSLKRISGTQLPIPTLPITGSQLFNLVQKLDTSSFNEYEAKLYKDLCLELEDKQWDYSFDNILDMDIKAWAGSQIWARGNGPDNIEWSHSYFKKQDITSAWKLNLTLNFTDNLVIYYDQDAMNVEDTDATSKFFYVEPFTFWKDADGSFPYNTYVSGGSKVINFTMGRIRPSAGEGNLGNLSLSSNLWATDTVKFSAMYYPVSFDSTLLYFSGEETAKKDAALFDKNANIAAFHRISITMLRFLTVSASEGCMQYGNISSLDPRFLLPTMCFHNTYAFSDGAQNNFFTIELNASIPKLHSEVTAQFLFDQIQLNSEVEDEFGHLPPNAFAALLGLNTSWTVKEGLLNAYAEAAYISPACYLKEDHPEDVESIRYYMVDLYVRNNIDSGFLGYPYGSDSFSTSIGASYFTEKYDVDFKASFCNKGSFGYGENEISSIGWTKEYWGLKAPSSFNSQPTEKRLLFAVDLTYRPKKNIELSTSICLNNIWDYQHIKKNNMSIFQFEVGAKIELFEYVRNYLNKRNI